MKFTSAVVIIATAGSATAFTSNHRASGSKTALSASYLENLAGPKIPHRPTVGSGISSYLDSVPTSNARSGKIGDAFFSFLFVNTTLCTFAYHN